MIRIPCRWTEYTDYEKLCSSGKTIIALFLLLFPIQTCCLKRFLKKMSVGNYVISVLYRVVEMCIALKTEWCLRRHRLHDFEQNITPFGFIRPVHDADQAQRIIDRRPVGIRYTRHVPMWAQVVVSAQYLILRCATLWKTCAERDQKTTFLFLNNYDDFLYFVFYLLQIFRSNRIYIEHQELN